jgi:hypothetical protein
MMGCLVLDALSNQAYMGCVFVLGLCPAQGGRREQARQVRVYRFRQADDTYIGHERMNYGLYTQEIPALPAGSRHVHGSFLRETVRLYHRGSKLGKLLTNSRLVIN